jgi:ABC-type multidrug transport system permease subunit
MTVLADPNNYYFLPFSYDKSIIISGEVSFVSRTTIVANFSTNTYSNYLFQFSSYDVNATLECVVVVLFFVILMFVLFFFRHFDILYNTSSGAGGNRTILYISSDNSIVLIWRY